MFLEYTVSDNIKNPWNSRNFQADVGAGGLFVTSFKFKVLSCSKWYVGYPESKYRPRISLAHPPDCHFAHVQ